MMQFLGMLAAIALTAFCWGVYGPVLHFGREAMHSNLRPFMCVGLAYFVIAVIVPLALLARGGERGGWTSKGVLWSMLAGTAGSLGALGVILALGFGGKLCIHPKQVAVVHRGFAPGAAQLAKASAIVAAADSAGAGAVRLNGQLIDRPMVERARRMLAQTARRGEAETR